MSDRENFYFERAGEERIPGLPAHVRTTLAALRAINESIPSRPLYKYMAPEHAARMLGQGSVRIGTLGYYRAREAQDSLRETRPRAPRTTSSPPRASKPPTSCRPGHGHSGRHRRGLRRSTTSGSCAPSTPTRTSTASRTSCPPAPRGGYTACVEIVDVPGFFRELTRGLEFAHPRQRGEAEVQVSAVTYGERALPHEYNGYISPAFLKEHRFSVESEVRGVWRTPKPEEKQYCDFSRPSLKRYIRQVDMPSA